MATYPMDPVDAAWYHMDGPANLAMVTGMMLARERFDFERVRSLCQQRILDFDRFRQRVVERGFPVASPVWEDMPHFDIDQHIHHVALPAPHNHAALVTLLNDIASSPLDGAQPLWQMHVVDDVDGGGAVIMRYHHCIGDGAAMMAVVAHLADVVADAPVARGSDGAADQASPDLLLAGAFDTIERITRTAFDFAGSALDVLAHPQQTLDKAKRVLQGAGMLVGELMKAPDPRSPFKGDFGLRKHVAWSKPVTIDDVKAIGVASGAKVNDVLVAAMTGALRGYLRQRGVDVDDTSVRAMVPVDLRPPERAGKLGNEFGLVILDLPVTARRRMDRLAQTKARMDALKRSPEAVAMLAVFNIIGRGPKPVEDFATHVFGSKASVVMTNVAGPAAALRFAGVPVDRMLFWVPHPGRQLGMGISILSYRGTATLAVITDARLVPDPEKITDLFNREFVALVRAARATASAGRDDEPARRPAKAAAHRAARRSRPRTGTGSTKR